MYVINCEHPVLINNKAFKRFRYRVQRVHLGSREIALKDCNFRVDLNPHNYDICPEIMTDYYFILEDGSTQPIFFVVPCGKCALCRERKVNNWVNRAACESQVYDTPQYFVTLTYQEKFLPKDGLRLGDVQKFLKRLRIMLERDYDYTDEIRYVCCGEYGTEKHRPHYHLLLWNMPNLLPSGTLDDYLHTKQITAVENLCQRAWEHRYFKDEVEYHKEVVFSWTHSKTLITKTIKCRPHHDFIGIVDVVELQDLDGSDNAAAYVMKYLKKDCVIPKYEDIDGTIKDCNPTFFHASRGNWKRGTAGLGSAYLDRNSNSIKDVIRHGGTHFKLTGFEKPHLIPPYFFDRLLPSLSMKYGHRKYKDGEVVEFSLLDHIQTFIELRDWVLPSQWLSDKNAILAKYPAFFDLFRCVEPHGDRDASTICSYNCIVGTILNSSLPALPPSLFALRNTLKMQRREFASKQPAPNVAWNLEKIRKREQEKSCKPKQRTEGSCRSSYYDV